MNKYKIDKFLEYTSYKLVNVGFEPVSGYMFYCCEQSCSDCPHKDDLACDFAIITEEESQYLKSNYPEYFI